MTSMSDAFVFYPPHRLGLTVHFAAIMILGGATGAGIWFAAQANLGVAFLLALLPAGLSVILVPILVYRTYSLSNASYTLERDGIRLRWGWRVVDIPMNMVIWVHPASELTYPVSLPRLRWPGSYRGTGHMPRAPEVEFMAADARELVLIATAERIYAISPTNPQAFLTAFQRFTEAGSLQPIKARSIHPTALLGRIWASKPARSLLLSGAILSLLMIILVSLVITTRATVIWGFFPDSSPGDPVPAIRLLLLPVINGLFFLSNMILGLFFFRSEENRPLAYLVWGAGSFTPLLFFIAIISIMTAS